MSEYTNHYSVLLNETVDALEIKADGIYVDATLGGGGHTELILSKLGSGKLISFDQDIDAIKFNQEKFDQQIKSGKLILVNDNFLNLTKNLRKMEIDGIDGIVFDLGVSSEQFDNGDRGFSYRYDAKLDMRMNQDAELTAETIVNQWDFQEIYYLLNNYGEEKFAKQIARNIEKAREESKISTTFQLVEIIKQSLPQNELKKKGHPAKKTFQALRIAVNDEIENLKSALNQSAELLKVNGHISAISFHSLEDRVIKQVFNKLANQTDPNLLKMPIIDLPEEKFKVITKKPTLPTVRELNENNRSHSAKLRILERIKK